MAYRYPGDLENGCASGLRMAFDGCSQLNTDGVIEKKETILEGK